jgi:uncharacterized protein (DUF2225 family)
MSPTVITIELRCPNCTSDFTSQGVKPTGKKVRQHTDFCPESTDGQPLRYSVHMCPRCGFAGREDSFSGTESLGYEVQRHVWDDLTPRLAKGVTEPSEKYEFAAKIAGWECPDPLNVADLWLRAAWCCVEEGDTEAERFYRRHAAWSFEEALEDYDEVHAGDRATVTYLVGELWRRIGDNRLAKAWFDRVSEEITNPAEQTWLVVLARKQRNNPVEWLV